MSSSDDNNLITDSDEDEEVRFSRSRTYGTVLLLILINALNYIDRFTIAGIPEHVKRFFNIGEADFGLLQTVFFVSYTILAPGAGYLGDRFSRKYIIMAGMTVWSTITLASSFIPGHLFGVFALARCLVGVGEACYATVAPTLIADLFVGKARVLVFGLFYFSTPAGGGLGFILGSLITQWTGNWQWSLRFTSVFGLALILIMAFLHRDPPRGKAEGGSHLSTTNLMVDLRSLAHNRSFLLISAGFTCISFVLGSLAWYSVDYLQLGLNIDSNDPSVPVYNQIPLAFGLTTCLAGIVGVLSGSSMGSLLKRWYRTGDALLCAATLYACSLILFFALLSPTFNIYLCLFLVFLAEYCLCFNMALLADMTMSVVLPTRRSMASAMQTVMIHALGDCLSPSIVGKIADSLTTASSEESKFYGLQRALFLNPFICLLGAIFFSVTINFFVADVDVVSREIERQQTNSWLPTNVALNKPVYSTANDNHLLTDGDWTTGTKPDDSVFPYIILDLNGLYRLDRIRLTFDLSHDSTLPVTVFTWDHYNPICDLEFRYPWHTCVVGVRPKQFSQSLDLKCISNSSMLTQYLIIGRGGPRNTVKISAPHLTEIEVYGERLAPAFVPNEFEEGRPVWHTQWQLRNQLLAGQDKLETGSWPAILEPNEHLGDVTFFWVKDKVVGFAGVRGLGRLVVLGSQRLVELILTDANYAFFKSNLVEWLTNGKSKGANLIYASSIDQPWRPGDILLFNRTSTFNVQHVYESITFGLNSVLLGLDGWPTTKSVAIIRLIRMLHFKQREFIPTWATETATNTLINSTAFLPLADIFKLYKQSWSWMKQTRLVERFHDIDSSLLKRLIKKSVQRELVGLLEHYSNWFAHHAPCDLKPLKVNGLNRNAWLNYNFLLMAQLSRRSQLMPGLIRSPGHVQPHAMPENVSVCITSGVRGRLIPVGAYAKAGQVFGWKILRQSPKCGKSCKLRIGCQTDFLTSVSHLRRFPLVSHSRPLCNKGRWVSPVGGVIYVELERNVKVTIEFNNVYRYPWFDKRNAKSMASWDVERWLHSGVPMTHYMGDSMHYCLPTISLLSHSSTSLTRAVDYFDKAIKLIHNYRGSKWEQSPPELFVVDKQISTGWGHSGYPMMGRLAWAEYLTNYNTSIASGGSTGVIHELGHNLQVPAITLVNGREVTNNIYIMAVDSRLLNKSFYQFGDEYAMRDEQLITMTKGWLSNSYKGVSISYYAYLAHYFGDALVGNVFNKYANDNLSPFTERDKAVRWVLELSLESGYDLIPLHRLYGFPCDKELRRQVMHMPCFVPKDQLTLQPKVRAYIRRLLNRYDKRCTCKRPAKVEAKFNFMEGIDTIRPPYISIK